jgi:hypothetical protein
MPDSFRQLCTEIDRATKTIITLEQCEPHYQRVLDYIRSHPEERDDIATLLANHVRHGYCPGGLRSDISLVRFLMAVLKWPEIKAAAEERYNDGGNASYGHEIQKLLSVYDAA